MSTHTRLRPKTVALSIAAVVVLVACAALATRLLRRADITDPAVLAKMPLDALRDRELETLVRAAFQNAASVKLEAEEAHARTARSVMLTDRQALSEIANTFAIGPDDEQLPLYEYPGTTYTRVIFDGPFKPDFSFVSQKVISVNGFPKWLRVRTAFAKKIADLLHLEDSGHPPAAANP